MALDLVIRGGSIVDGMGVTRFLGDVGITDGVIAEVGRIAERGAREIDAQGLVVTPGFIDGHTHMDAQVNWDPLGTSACWHGVTTAVMGNCGFTLAPSRSHERELVLRNLERAEDISAAAMAAGITWKWETFPEYLDAMETLPLGINYASNIGHSALRTWAMGERAFEQEANDDDLALMKGQIAAALDAGAMGFTTSRNAGHRTSDDRPVASSLASWDELRALVGVLGAKRAGLFEISHEEEARSVDPELRGRALDRLKDLAVGSGVPVTFGVTIAGVQSREVWEDHLAILDRTADAGGRMFGQSHSKGISILLSFRTALPFDKLPVWDELRAHPIDEQARMLRDPALRAKLVESAHNSIYCRAIGGDARKPEYDKLLIYDRILPPFRSVAEVAAERGMDPVELMIELALETDMSVFFLQFFQEEDAEDTLRIMQHPRTVMTFSDTGAHVSQIADSSIFSFLLAYWVREKRRFSLEEAVRMITAVPADAWGFGRRGRIAPGMIADINVFDPDTIMPKMPECHNDLPAGARRLIQKCDGFSATIIGGQLAFEHGEHTGALNGRLVRQRAQ